MKLQDYEKQLLIMKQHQAKLKYELALYDFQVSNQEIKHELRKMEASTEEATTRPFKIKCSFDNAKYNRFTSSGYTNLGISIDNEEAKKRKIK